MSTRMRLAPISHHNQRSSSGGRWAGYGRLAIGVSVAVGLLVGCSQGDATDAERGKLVDAQRTSVVDALQATQAARLLESGTPGATVTAES